MHRIYALREVREENARTRTLVCDGPLEARPGQFVMVWLPGVGEKPFSVAGDDPMALMVVGVGPVTHAINALKVGDRLWVRGPLGQGYELEGERLMLVAGGYGVAPLRFLAEQALRRGMCVEACVGARSAADLLLCSDLAALGVRLCLATEDGSAGERGLVTALLTGRLAAWKPDLVCACGPVPMLEAVERLCAQQGVACQLSWEAEMRCGQGVCGSCECRRPGWLACVDGPVTVG
ncbi:MAG: dihydroorotate dehydrogenase electron transfer subunit [Chloroflexi bacterium]|nr:dihydroorotate dehydrogenase electron transfer subunit [Chloroflexota bacterium]